MFSLFKILSLLIVPSLGTTGPLLKMTAIQFDTINDDYIEYYPDWSSLTTVVSACGWIKDLGSFQLPTIFNYHGNELQMLADGQWTTIFAHAGNYSSGFPVSKGTWFLACTTWSRSSLQHQYYVNRNVIGSRQSRDRSLKTGGKLRLGYWFESSTSFGGQMMYLNFYSKELSANEIARMVQKGMCAHIVEVDEHEASRVIKWEDLVQLERSGAATNMYVAECVDLLNKQSERRQQNATLAELEKELEEVNTRLNSTVRELEESQSEKEEIEEKLSTKVNSTLAELEVTQTKYEQELEEVNTRLNSTLRELEEMSTNQNRTWDWNIFLTGEFLNRTFTTEDAQLLRSSWEEEAGTSENS